MIDETSRKLIERAAAHLKARAPVAPTPMPQPAPQAAHAPAAYPENSYAPLAYQTAVAPQPVYQPQAAAPQPMPQAPVYAPQPRAYQAPHAQPVYVQQPQAAVVNGAPATAYHQPAHEPAFDAAYAAGYARTAPRPATNGYQREVEGPSLAPPPASYSRQVSIDRGSLARCGITVPSAQRSRVAEEFRIVKRQLVAKYMDEPDDAVANRNRVIMVTSTRPREGKTFTAINIALSIATEQDLKVLLIDLDTKHHAMQEMMGIPASYGLTDLLANPEIDFSEVVLRTNLPNLTVMSAGSPNVRSPELLSSRRTRAIFNEMAQRYNDRFIVFDAPAVLASSDPAILASLVGQIVVVVEADHTQQEELESAIGLLSACPNISLLLNKVRTSAADQFGAYSDY
ncbi:MAG TPA: AAA family ATPase [Stellaceae bacterium]|jgi:protein-tyrosine kinase|nr:AAA family ATPase [Stellaceae bacterium]